MAYNKLTNAEKMDAYQRMMASSKNRFDMEQFQKDMGDPLQRHQEPQVKRNEMPEGVRMSQRNTVMRDLLKSLMTSDRDFAHSMMRGKVAA